MTLTWGSGDRVALLVHGMLGAATQYHQLGPELAARGYRVLAVDLPGHGEAPALPNATMDDFVNSVLGTTDVDLAIGHSLGAIVLWNALPQLRPKRAVYVDVPLTAGGAPPAELRQHYEAARGTRTEAQLRATRPDWSAEDCRVEADAAARFDIDTAVALERSYVGEDAVAPTIPSLVIRADPSRYVSDGRARELAEMGFCVRSVAGAGHCVWYGRMDDFMGVLGEWLD
ncbi:alpha/beta fold hydrolase [Kribbella sp. NPDC054772]